MPAKYVIHTVGPLWNGGRNNERQLLAHAYKNCLRIAIENGIKTIAFPNISTGVYGFPKKGAAEIAVAEVNKFPKLTEQIEKVIFCCFEQDNFEIYTQTLEKYKNL